MGVLITILFIILSLCTLAQSRGETNRHLLPVLYILLVLIATFRSSETPDYPNYERLFLTGEFERGEIGFIAFVTCVRAFFSNAVVIFGAIAVLSVGLKCYAIRKLSPFIAGSLLIYLSHFFILHDMIQIRAAIASGVLMIATKYLFDRDAKRFFIAATVAVLFHYSALIIFPLWFLRAQKINKFVYLSMLPAALLLALKGVTFGHLASLIPIEAIQSLWSMYEMSMELDIGSEINLFNIMHIIRVGMCMFILLFIDKIATSCPMAVIWVKMYTISLVAFWLLSDVPVMSFRISELYQIIEILLIPAVICIPKFSKWGRCLIIVFAGCCLFMNIFYNMYVV